MKTFKDLKGKDFDFDDLPVVPFSSLVGKVPNKIFITQEPSMLVFVMEDAVYIQGHEQECCEEVYLDDTCGDLDDLVGNPILISEEVFQEDEVGTWAFYKLSTKNGDCTLTWRGKSNGCYSERVDLRVLKCS